jgi:hypothetical protein
VFFLSGVRDFSAPSSPTAVREEFARNDKECVSPISIRIKFVFLSTSTALLLDVGTHEIYE